jgi:predicted ATPase
LVVEDAHWADPASLDLIDYVVRNIAEHPILFIINHRPDEGLPNWGAHPSAIELQLTDLSTEASLDIIRSLVGHITLPEIYQQLILNKCSGNPFFIGEVVRALIDAGAIRQDVHGNWQFDEQMEALELPDTIHGIIISRIDRLIATDRRILQVASVVGRLFAYQTLRGVYTYSDIGDILRERLSYLAELGITDTDNVELEIHRFVHLTTRDVVYESLSFEHRRTVHQGIGDFIEKTSIGALGEQIDLLAYHFYEAKAWEKALEYNLLAAKHAQREYANDTAITACQRSLEAAINISPQVDTTQERLSTYETLCEVLTLVGRYDEALQHLSAARALLETDSLSQDQKRTLAEFYRKTADVYERRSEYEVAFSWLNKGLEYLEEDKPTIEIVKLNIMAAGVYHRQGENDEAILWCRKSLELASRLKTREGQQSMAQAYYLMGAAYYRLGLLQEAAEQCNSSVQIYQEIDDLVGQARAYNNLAIAYTDLGDWTRASQAYHQSLEINERIGNIQELGFVANNLAEIHRDHGEWDVAIDLYRQSNAIWKQIGGTLPDAVTLSNLAQVYIYQKNWDEARESLTSSQRLFTEIGSNDFMPELERRWGEFFLKIGETDRAMEHLTHSIELASTQDAQFELGLSFRVLGEAHLIRKDFEQAEIALLRSRRILNDLNSEYEAAKTTLSLTQLAFEAGDPIDQQALRRATSVFSQLGAQVELNRAVLMEQWQNNTDSP